MYRSFLIAGLALVARAEASTQDGEPSQRAHGPRPPNFILVLLDDVGTDKIGFYGLANAWGETAARTPNLDDIRAQGVMFQRAYSAPLCSPTRAQVMTGRFGFRTGMLNISETVGPCPEGTIPSGAGTCCPIGEPGCASPSQQFFPNGYSLPCSEVFLPEMLRESTYAVKSNYASGAFGKWHLTSTRPDPCHAVNNGFEIFSGHLWNNESPVVNHYAWTKYTSHGAGAACRATSPCVLCAPSGETTCAECEHSNCDWTSQDMTGRWDAEETYLDARNWIDAKISDPDHEPFFAYVCFNPPHRPFQVPPRDYVSPATWAELAVRGLDHEGLIVDGVRTCTPGTDQEQDSRDARLVYKASLEAVDALIGKLVYREPGTNALIDNTYVFVIGDNGTPDQVIQATVVASETLGNDAPFPANHSKSTTYERGIHVPFVAAGPGVAVGADTNALMCAADFWRTLADLAGANPDALVPRAQSDSYSFRYWLENPTGSNAPDPRPFVYAELAARNGMIYEPTSATWSPARPTIGLGYPRIVISPDGFKYFRRRIGATANCAQPPSFCSTSTLEELYRLYDDEGVVDPNETLSICGDSRYATALDALRGVMTAGFSGN